jgi:hypothetical protein
MNAYELAEKLEYDYWHAKANITMFKSADMLRQQADRIAELERLVSDMIYEKASGVYDRPQTKPLSDEEIDKIIYSVDWAYDPVLLVRAIEERHGIK